MICEVCGEPVYGEGVCASCQNDAYALRYALENGLCGTCGRLLTDAEIDYGAGFCARHLDLPPPEG